MRDLCPVSVHGNRRNTPRMQARVTMFMAGAAISLMAEIAWVALAHAQADMDLSNPAAIGVFATDTDWSIAKNGASGTASWTVGVTKISVSDQLVEVFGEIKINNTGTGPALLGNIIVNLQRPWARGQRIRFCGSGRRGCHLRPGCDLRQFCLVGLARKCQVQQARFDLRGTWQL